MMRYILVILGLLACLSAEATTYYVRPVADCPTNGNGTAYACASSGGGVGAWSKMTGVVQATPTAGETVKACGTFTTADVDTATVMLTINWTNSGVILDGDCSADGGLSRAIFDGGGTHDRAIDSGSGGAVAAVIKNINITGFDTYGIIGQNLASDDWVIDNISCDGSLLTSQCIRNLTDDATGWTIKNSAFSNCYNDCIFSEEPMTFTDNVATEWSTGNSIGDFYQQGTGPCTGFVFRRNVLRSSKDIKQAVIINQCSGAAGVIFEDNTVVKIGQSTDTSAGFVGLFVDAASGTVEARRNYITGGRINLFVSGGTALVAESNVLGPATNTNLHCGTSTSSCILRNNTVNGSGASYAAIEMQAAGANGFAYNNAVVGGIGINLGLTGTETNNVIIATTPCTPGGSAGACHSSDDTDNTTMGWVGGTNPTSSTGYKLAENSPLRRACKDLNLGNIQDNGNRAFSHPPSCGAWEVGSGDSITNNTRTTATTRTNRN